ncbi:MAG: radical SAM protein [Clostridia bacterium]|nr:radical SAM protein [Clostridia bacterium]
MESAQLEAYLHHGTENILKGIVSASLQNPQAALFMAKYALHSKTARGRRERAAAAGEHIPPFLIASITDKCNLHCKGCYARANHSCTDGCGQGAALLRADEWDSVFTQAEALGVQFILLAGGEPFVRKDVLLQAGRHPGVLFPIFTNGTMIDDAYERVLEQNRNLLPVISIEGNQSTTDARRGAGVYQVIEKTMARLQKSGVLFGASVTVTRQNMQEVLSDAFVHTLKDAGAKAIVYVEYVPVDASTVALAPDEGTREAMMRRLDALRCDMADMVLIAFPGDERASGGCLAAGRGFFHINAHGGAEPCPFSPYSDTNVRDVTLREALHSPLFRALQSSGSLMEEHTGGCVLFAQQKQVERILQEQAV